jgi:hypothetical protein
MACRTYLSENATPVREIPLFQRIYLCNLHMDPFPRSLQLSLDVWRPSFQVFSTEITCKIPHTFVNQLACISRILVLHYFDQMFTGRHLPPKVFIFLGVHSSAIMRNSLYMVVRRNAGPEILMFFVLFRPQNLSPRPKMFSSQPSVTRHLNIWSK